MRTILVATVARVGLGPALAKSCRGGKGMTPKP